MSLPRPSFETLRFVRDNQPTEAQLLEFGEESSWEALANYSSLRKSGMVVLKEGKWVLLPEHLSVDGRSFDWGHERFQLDEERVDHLMRGGK